MTKLNKGISEFFFSKVNLNFVRNFIKDPSRVSIYIARSLETDDLTKTA